MRTTYPWEQGNLFLHNEKPEPAEVPVGSLNVDTTYQAEKPRNPRLVRSIGKSFDLAAFGRLRVVRRADGRLFIVDGRHRWEGAAAANRVFLPCDLYDVHDIKREIEIFLMCNTRSRKVNQGMLFMAEVASGDAQAIALDQAVKSAGLAIVDANTVKREFMVPKLACIAALKSLSGHGSATYAKRATPVPPQELDAALRMIAGLAPPNAAVTEHAALGFVWLVHNYPTVREHAARLADIGWPRIDAAARAVGPRPKIEDAGKALLAVIDYGRRGDKRVAPDLKLPTPPEHVLLTPMARAA